jgi:hypothetical protein
MDILKKTKDIQDLFAEAISEENVELELIFGQNEVKNPINKTIFLKLLDTLKKDYNFVEETTNLDIKCSHNKGLSNIRCTIKDIYSIKKYCVTDSLENIDNLVFLKKSNYDKSNLNTHIKNTDYNFRLNLKTEEDLDYDKEQINAYNNIHDTKTKHYRYKKRYSFITPDNLFRIDLTVVKSTSYELIKDQKFKPPRFYRKYNLTNTFKEAKILNNPETYELEIEFIGKEENTYGISKILDYYKKLDDDIKNPVNYSVDHVYDPLSLETDSVWKQGYEPSKDTFMVTPIIPSSDKIVSPLKDKLMGKKVKVKESYFANTDQMDILEQIESPDAEFPGMTIDINAIIIDYDEKKGDNKGLIPGSQVLLRYNKTIHADIKRKLEIQKLLNHNIPNYNMANFNKDKLPKKKIQYMNKLLDELNKLQLENKPLEIWVPITEIYSDYHDIEQIIYEYYIIEKGVEDIGEMKGGAKTPAWAKKHLKKKSSTSSEMFNPQSDGDNNEYTGDILNKQSIDILSDKCIELLNNHVYELYCIINNYKLILSESEKKVILSRYSKITNQKYDPKFDIHKQKFKLLGPQPITLNHEHLNSDSTINIIHGYAVTEKADGYRSMLYIINNKGYLITPKMDVIYTGIKYPDVNGEWLLDGEYITKNKDGGDIKLYMIFDIYFNGNPKDVKPAYNHIWYSEDDRIMTRSKILDTFKNVLGASIIINKQDSIEIGYKKYQYGAMNKDDDDSLIFQKCRDMYNPDVYRYKIDGLILMPIYTKVKGDKSGKDVVNIGGTWDYNFKWKPPEENTIDFKVSFEKEGKLNKDKIFPIITEVENGDKILHRYKKANLIVGYDQKQDETLDYCMILLLNERKKYVKEKIFDPPDTDILVNKTNLLLDNNKIICEDGSEMKDGDIVEMRYNPNGENDMIWEPLRVRYDKTNAQFFTIANNVWETISSPITENVIKGIEEDVYDKKEDPNDLYYVGNSDSESKALRDYHNYIKSNLIRGVCNSLNKNIQVMDTSIGRGGDIKKYIDEDCRITYLFGLDIANVNEACRRYHFEGRKPQATFLQADTSLNIKSKKCSMDIDHTKIMLDILYGTVKSVKGQYKKFYRNYKGIAKKGFDVINSQFTFHYYLKDKQTFDGYLTNLKENLNKGGYFIATFYDGMKLYELLKDKENIKYENGIGDKIYSITKKYELIDFDYREDNTSNMFGNVIDVYMDSIGKEFPEYLVNIEFVIQEMSKIGLELTSPDYMDKKYSTIFKKECLVQAQDGRGGFENILQVLQGLDKKSPDSTIIKKFYSRLPEMFKNKDLQLLSGLNNYLIFRKK